MLEDRLQHRAQRRLDHPVSHRWYPQRTLLLAPRLGDVVPSDALRPVNPGAQRFAQARQIGVQIARVLRNRDVIHPRRPAVGRHLRERRPQRRFGVDLVDQAVPLAAFDPFIEGRQHPLCPHLRFGSKFRGAPDRPLRRRGARTHASSAITSPGGHYRRSLPVARQCVSIFLHPFAPPALPGFIATMSAVTPAGGRGPRFREGRLLRLLCPLASHAGLLASRNPPSEPSVSNHRPAPMVALTPNPSAPWASPPVGKVWASPLDRRLARRYGRIEFVNLRMTHSPPVAPHPASRRRSYVRLQAGVGIPGEDFHLPD